MESYSFLALFKTILGSLLDKVITCHCSDTTYGMRMEYQCSKARKSKVSLSVLVSSIHLC